MKRAPKSSVTPATLAKPVVEPKATVTTLEHVHLLAAHVFQSQIGKISGDGSEFPALSRLFSIKVLLGLKPRDAIEEMLIGQMVMTHGRLAYLNSLAHQQSSVQSVAVMHEAADRAANTFRRQMLAFAEYRRPGATPATVQQLNLAGQMVVNNGVIANENATNEQGTDGRAQVVPAQHPGACGTAEDRPAQPALDVQHRAQDGRGQAPGEPERVATRRAKR